MSATCRCCGIPEEHPIRAKLRVCVMCDDCDGKHGDELQELLIAHVAGHPAMMWAAIGRACIDDAHLTNRLRFVGDQHAASLHVAEPPKRWHVVIARALLQHREPDLQAVINAVLLSHLGTSTFTDEYRADVKRDLVEAAHAVDDSIYDVDVTLSPNLDDPQHMIVDVKIRTLTPGMMIIDESGPDLPPDIMSRKRAEA